MGFNTQYSDIFCWKNVSSFCSYSHFCSKKFQHICISLNVNFNESLTNDIVGLGLTYFSLGNPRKGNWQTVQTQIDTTEAASDQDLYALCTTKGMSIKHNIIKTNQTPCYRKQTGPKSCGRRVHST